MASARQREQAAEAASVKSDNWHCRPGQTAPHGYAPLRCVKRSDAQQLNKRSRRPQWPGTRTTIAVKKQSCPDTKSAQKFRSCGISASGIHSCTLSAMHMHSIIMSSKVKYRKSGFLLEALDDRRQLGDGAALAPVDECRRAGSHSNFHRMDNMNLLERLHMKCIQRHEHS